MNLTTYNQLEYAIPDVHGDVFALRTMYKRIPSQSLIIFLGDVVNKGSHSLEAIETLQKFSKRSTIKLLWGNHDLLFVRALSGSFSAKVAFFRQPHSTYLFSELGLSHLVKPAHLLFTHIAENGVTNLSRTEQKYLKEIEDALKTSLRIKSCIQWITDNFTLFYISEKNVLYVHAGIPFDCRTKAPLLSHETLSVMCKSIKLLLKTRDVDNQLFTQLDTINLSPLRMNSWPPSGNTGQLLCDSLGVSAIVVGHTVMPLSYTGLNDFPLILHDYGAAAWKQNTPSIVEINNNGMVYSHLYLNGKWTIQQRGII